MKAWETSESVKIDFWMLSWIKKWHWSQKKHGKLKNPITKQPKIRIRPGVRLGQSMLGNISYKRNIGKNTKLLFLKKEEITKKQEICQGVWLGESMIGNRLGQVIQFKKMQALF